MAARGAEQRSEVWGDNGDGGPHAQGHGERLAESLSWRAGGCLLGSWFWCSQIPSSSVQALAQDAENDVWLNAISLSFPVSLLCVRWTNS